MWRCQGNIRRPELHRRKQRAESRTTHGVVGVVKARDFGGKRGCARLGGGRRQPGWWRRGKSGERLAKKIKTADRWAGVRGRDRTGGCRWGDSSSAVTRSSGVRAFGEFVTVVHPYTSPALIVQGRLSYVPADVDGFSHARQSRTAANNASSVGYFGSGMVQLSFEIDTKYPPVQGGAS